MKRKRLWLLAVLLPLAILGAIALSSHAHAQNRALLKPPPGAKMAIVVFEDMECPDCARANPLLEQAARAYKIPLVRYDFPLPMHEWAFQAAVYGRYFETKAKKLADEFRDHAFQRQAEITKDNLRQFADQFAKEHNTTFPFVVDPQGKLAAAVKRDQELGTRVGISHTPTIYVVTQGGTVPPFVEVVDRKELFQIIDALKAQIIG